MQDSPGNLALEVPPVGLPVAQPPDGQAGQLPVTPEFSPVVTPEPSPFVWALGQVEPHFPSLAIEKEFAQVLGRGNNGGLTDRQALQAVLADRANRYLVRQMCWVFLVEGLETYILRPRDPADFDLLVDAVRGEPNRGDVDIVIGERGHLAPPEVCSGLAIPLVTFDQLYSFDRDSLIAAIPRPEGDKEEVGEEGFQAAARELFDRVMQLADNAGAFDDHRALNYLATRYPAIYTATADAFQRNQSLAGVEVRPSRLSGARKIVDVVLSYTGRETEATEKYFVRVDVTEKFPFIVTRIAPFYER